MQPRVGINLEDSTKTMFTEIFAGNGGVDSYTNAISDTYQDNFGEGIFTGKGIYDLNTFCTVLDGKIPENTVLSHDLLEGSYLRCGLATDIMLLDGYPKTYLAYLARLSRWIRGDYQIIGWLKNTSGLNKLSKFKIFDNIRRSLVEILVMLNIIILSICAVFGKESVGYGIAFSLLSIITPSIIEVLNHIIYRKENIKRQKRFTKGIDDITASFYRAVIGVMVLPTKAYISLSAMVKTIYRMAVTKEHLLEWTTSEEAERISKNDLGTMITKMLPNLVISCLLIWLTYLEGNINAYFKIFMYALASLFMLAPIVMVEVSREKANIKKIDKLSNEDKEYVKEIAKKTWEYFKEYMNKENSFLPPDNLQESRREKVAQRTSSTNIGLGLLTIVSAYDLNFISLEEALNLLENSLNTIKKLEKWNGHLYNWYNTKNLMPLLPKYVSTVDSGNFVGYLYTLRAFLETNLDCQYKDRILNFIDTIDNLINETDFSFLYSKENRLLSIGYNVDENQMTDTYYDLLASEARQASLVAIAKKDIPSKHWNNLSRTLTKLGKYKGLISWSGTAFEYLMPNINIRRYEGSLLDESCKFMIMSQIKYSTKLGIPWGISEAAFNLKDLNSNYQYKAFGVPWLGLKRGLADEMVVSSYGGILAITDYPNEVVQNLKILEQQGMYGKYGFYESIDYTPSRLAVGKEYAVVETYMAHHQALILLSINNLINDNIFQKRFMKNPEIKAVDILLQERMPRDMLITKEKKEKTRRIKYIGYDNYVETKYTQIEEYQRKSNVLSSEDYLIEINDKGEGFSKYKDILVNKYKETSMESCGIFFYIRNVDTGEIWKTNYEGKEDKYEVTFSEAFTEINKSQNKVDTSVKIIAASLLGTEIRSLKIKNISEADVNLEVIGIFKPVLSKMEDDIAHPAFNNLFLKYSESEKGDLIVKRNKRGNTNEICLGANLFLENADKEELEYEIDASKAYEMINEGKAFESTIGLVTEPCVALKRRVKIKPLEEANLNLVLSVSEIEENVVKNLEYYRIQENVKQDFNIARAKAEEEARYLNLSRSDVETINRILPYIMHQNPAKSIYMEEMKYKEYKQSDLWKYGISGDIPIILVTAKYINDVYVVKEILKVYESLRIKGIRADLVILDYEKNVYERYVKDQIIQEILNLQIGYLQNISGGIFILNANEIEDEELLKFRANIIINGSKGNVLDSIKEMEEEYKKSIKAIAKDRSINAEDINFEPINPNINMDNLKFYNGFGGFTDDGREYIIKTNKQTRLPRVWSNVLANEKFGTVITDNLGGFTYSKNSRLNRITAWANSPSCDIPSEIIYLKDLKHGISWTLNSNVMPDDNDYYTIFGLGYVKTYHSSLGLIQESEIFVPEKDSIKVNIIRLKNTLSEKRKIKLVYYIKPVLGEDETKTSGYINLELDRDKNVVYAKNIYGETLSKNVYVSSSEKIMSYTGNNLSFAPDKNLSAPKAIDDVELSMENGLRSSVLHCHRA